MTTGLDVFDTTVQETNLWLIDAAERLGLADRHQAYVALRAGLHALRDRLPAEAVLALSAQLPILLRGIFIEGWRLSGKSANVRTAEAFAQHVDDSLPPGFPFDGATVARVSLEVLANHVDEGVADKVARLLPTPLRLWAAAVYTAA